MISNDFAMLFWLALAILQALVGLLHLFSGSDGEAQFFFIIMFACIIVFRTYWIEMLLDKDEDP